MPNSFRSLDDLLFHYQCKEKGTETHTRIPDHSKNIYGGKYCIPLEVMPLFYKLYNKKVFVQDKYEYLTEKQLLGSGPILVDIDFRYDGSIIERQHSNEHIEDMIELYLETIQRMIVCKEDHIIPIYVLEKPAINLNTGDPNLVKDGIHFIFGIQMNHGAQLILREKIKKEISNILEDLPLINDYDGVLDIGISKGTTNWQMFGSRKPGHEAYQLVKYYQATCKNGQAAELIDQPINASKMKTLHTISARNKDMLQPELTPEISKQLTMRKKISIKKFRIKSVSVQVQHNFADIKTAAQCKQMLKDILKQAKNNNEYHLKQAADYTQILGEKYYEPYSKWMAVGWALKTTSYSLFPAWILFSSKAKAFVWEKVPEFLEMWNNMDSNGGLTFRSIMYWAKEEDIQAYIQIQSTSIEYYIHRILESDGEWDIAQLVYQMYGDIYKCVNIRNKIWYEYVQGRWREIDSGTSLRRRLSTDLVNLLRKKMQDYLNQYEEDEAAEEKTSDEDIKRRGKIKKLSELCQRLKKTSWKQNIMKECCEHFFDKDFMNKLDKNTNLLCFNNGVLDMEDGCSFRKGRPQDYISLCTKTDYIPFNPNNKDHMLKKKEIEKFMQQYFPNPALNNYMWEHLASVLRGDNRNQTFNIYTGEGRNGKSKLVELMGLVLGDYKGTVPITLITQKRGSIGGATPEIAQLRGLRYAVMQEPSKGMKINEGVMKELTGGDPIQGRALFRDTVTFVPQFTLVVCTNHLFDIASNDDGTWRRIRVCDFVSRFVEKPSIVPEDHEFKVDKNISKHFERWVPIFTGMLVEKLKETGGLVKDCDIVMAASQTYKAKQDYFTGFYTERIILDSSSRIKKRDVLNEFTEWYAELYGGKIPKGRELYEFLTKKIGKPTTSGWKGYKLRHSYEDELDIEPNGI